MKYLCVLCIQMQLLQHHQLRYFCFSFELLLDHRKKKSAMFVLVCFDSVLDLRSYSWSCCIHRSIVLFVSLHFFYCTFIISFKIELGMIQPTVPFFRIGLSSLPFHINFKISFLHKNYSEVLVEIILNI